MKLEAFDSSYFCGKTFFFDDVLQNMFVYQTTFNMLGPKIDKGIEYITGWQSKVLFEWKLLPLHGAFMCNIKQFGYEIGLQFNNAPLVIDQNSFTTKILNAYILHDLEK